MALGINPTLRKHMIRQMLLVAGMKALTSLSFCLDMNEVEVEHEFAIAAATILATQCWDSKCTKKWDSDMFRAW